MHAIVCLLRPAALGLSSYVSSAAGQVDLCALHERDDAQQGAECARTQRSSATGSPAVFTGRVFLPGGEPAAGAVVVTSAGGQAVTDGDGGFELAVEVPLDAESVYVAAVANGAAHSFVTCARVELCASGPAEPIRLILAAGVSCQPSWIPTFGGAPGVNNNVNAQAVFDDGSGPALYASGAFTSAGGVAVNLIAKWDGTSWSGLWSGLNAAAFALTAFDDGSGPALYAGGSFTDAGGVAVNHIAKWDGTLWSALGTGVLGSSASVNTLAVFDDGTGSALYAGGAFTTAGGVAANRIAKWDGTSWSALGTGMDKNVFALTEFDDGSGPALYAGGNFTSAGGVAANRIAKWDGTSWSPLGHGMSGLGSVVNALTVFDDGSGPALYAGGDFTSAGGVPASRIARWDGASWSALSSGMNDSIHDLAVVDDGSGAALYAGGSFTSAGGVSASNIASWDGTSWSPLGSGMSGLASSVFALTEFDDGSGPALHAGGRFTSSGGLETNSIAKWDGTAWSALGSSLDNVVFALRVFDDGSGRDLYAGGAFTSVGSVTANRVAKWDGASWSALGSGLGGTATALTKHDDGSGPALYAGGSFAIAGGMAASNIARWDGNSWSALGGGLNDTVLALTEFDDGSGPALFAGGSFTSAGGVTAGRIAKWDGTNWSPLGSGIANGSVLALAVFDDGTGSALYVGGGFTIAGGVAASNIAKWDGTSWSPLGSGMSGIGSAVNALTVFDDGSGPALYAGGLFTAAGGAMASNAARWDGVTWSALSSGLNGSVFALAYVDDGSGPALRAGGLFSTAGGVAAKGIATWDGASWSALSSGVNGPVVALTDFDDGSGLALYAGGAFTVNPAGDSFLAKWGCPPITPLAGCAGNPATLTAQASGAPLGAPFPLRITGSTAVTGLGLVAYGAPGIDGSGCGLVVSGFGELLLALAPAPKALSSGLLADGFCDLLALVPSIPTLSGVVAYLQGAAIDAALPQPIELTNALAVTLGP